jgi:asparagine synthase (glutamine-hydrolysing)
MAVALEVRCPLLDHRFASLGAANLTEEKYREGLKTSLKRILAKRVSPSVLQRPKRGFSVPLSNWLSGPLRSLVADTLHQQAVRECGWLDAGTIGQVWNAFSRGQTQHAHAVWMLVNILHHLRDEQIDSKYQQLRESIHRVAA